MQREITTNGILYNEELINIDGAGFILYPDKSHTPEMIAEAIKEIRSNRDVVSLTIATEEDRDRLYRTEIFLHPAVRPLKWYEINADDYNILRRERRKGTTVDAYVEKFVLSHTAETTERNEGKYGSSIFGS